VGQSRIGRLVLKSVDVAVDEIICVAGGSRVARKMMTK
jgi:hypothetical protein